MGDGNAYVKGEQQKVLAPLLVIAPQTTPSTKNTGTVSETVDVDTMEKQNYFQVAIIWDSD